MSKVEEKTERLVDVPLTKVQMAALVGVMENVERARQVLSHATKDAETVIGCLVEELGFPGARIKITPELQAQGAVQIQLPE